MRILLIEDDERLCRSLSFQLEKEGFTTDTCQDGEDAFYYIDSNIHDLILLDRMLPGMDGLTILKKMRQSGNMTPVILLTALGELDDKVKGLDSGADDYLVKPIAFEELMARIRCMERRPREWKQSNMLSYGDITYHPDSNILKCASSSVTLSKREGSLMELFLHNKNQTLPRTTILAKIWGADAPIEDGNLDNYIHFLRRRLSGIHSQVSIQTIRGIGYRLEESDA